MRFIDEYMSNNLKPRAAERYLTSMRMVQPFLEGCYLDEINKAKIAEIVRERKKEDITDATVRRDLAYLSSLMSCASEWDWIENNPLIAYKKRSLKEADKRVRSLSKEEYKRLLKVADEKTRRFIIFAKETGVRFEEQFSLLHSNVDLSDRNNPQMVLADTKNRDSRIVPLSEEAVAQIRAQKKHPASKYVFWQEGGLRWKHHHVWIGFEKAIKEAEIEDFTWHDLRHTFASWARKGWHPWQHGKRIELDVLQKWLGHKSIHMTLRYAHLDVDDLHASVKRGTKRGTRPTDSKKERGGEEDE